VKAFDEEAERHLERLHEELRTGAFCPIPVKQVRIPKAGKPGEFRTLGIPTIFDRVCQQAVLNRLGPIFEPDHQDDYTGETPRCYALVLAADGRSSRSEPLRDLEDLEGTRSQAPRGPHVQGEQ